MKMKTMKIIPLAVLLLMAVCGKAVELESCQSKVEGSLPDCNCRPKSVETAVTSFISPMLKKITETKFFRYFFVNFDNPCPFWKEDGMCMNEACSVCTCDDKELPSVWVYGASDPSKPVNNGENNNFGWISTSSSSYGYDGHDESLGRVSLREEMASQQQLQTENASIAPKDDYIQFLHATEDCKQDTTPATYANEVDKTVGDDYCDEEDEVDDEWTSLHPLPSLRANKKNVAGVYVNLLENPERFTGYAGAPAHRVWKAIKEENCFGTSTAEQCYEKRIFFRVMSGLQASISTHIAKQYKLPSGKWGYNIPLYYHAVGTHQERKENLYFTFLFLYRAVMKAKPLLLQYPYLTGNNTEDESIRSLMRQFFASTDEAVLYSSSSSSSSSEQQYDAIQECSYGFNESILFQAPLPSSSSVVKEVDQLFSTTDDHLNTAIGEEEDCEVPLISTYQIMQQEKSLLQIEFRERFRNISRIMDCVSCEKCRLWGKLQILGIGTAIKILLTPSQELLHKHLLNRQEVIALINVLHQFSKSIEFIAYVQTHHPLTETEDATVLPGFEALQRSSSGEGLSEGGGGSGSNPWGRKKNTNFYV